MHIREYQAWLEQWDKSRTWEQVTLGHTLMHAVEELGEISKIVQMIEGYRPPKPPDPAALRDELALELSDLQVMLFKIAYLYGIDMEEAMVRGQHKANARFPDPTSGLIDTEAYRTRFRTYLRSAGFDFSSEND
jgi:NTP pyrophosphatase (non-canonical NTP hydrolase)